MLKHKLWFIPITLLSFYSLNLFAAKQATTTAYKINFNQSQNDQECDPSKSPTCVDGCDSAQEICFNITGPIGTTVTMNNTGKFIIEFANGKTIKLPAAHPGFDTTLGFSQNYKTLNFGDAGGLDYNTKTGLDDFTPVIKTMTGVKKLPTCPSLSFAPIKTGNITYKLTNKSCSIIHKPSNAVALPASN